MYTFRIKWGLKMETAIKIVKILNSEGYDGFVVGGAVRDRLMNIPHDDIDIATDARPEKVTELFKAKGFKVIPTGFDHGTVTLIGDELPPEGVEITTFRKDVSTDGRNATVKFAATIEEDLSRRDLTINSLAVNPITGAYIDMFRGIQDIMHRTIRCVGDADTRFREDNLRMLRALRFEATLGEHWVVDRDTRNAIVSNAHLIKNISSERIKAELDKCFAKADNPAIMINQMRETGLLKFILPELCECYGFAQNKYHKHDVYTHTLKALDAVPKEYPLIRWAALFHDLGKPASCENYGEPHASFHMHEKISVRLATTIMGRLRFSNEDKAYINNLINCHMFCGNKDMKDGAVRRFVAKVGKENIDAICILKWADRRGNPLKKAGPLDIDGTFLKSRFKKILEEDSAFKISDLNITGHDICLAFDIGPGPMVGVYLRKALDLVLETPALNNKTKLLQLLKL